VKKLWGIRHLRWYWHSIRFQMFLNDWRRTTGLASIAQQRDLDWLAAI
jgi:hypothetical protein